MNDKTEGMTVESSTIAVLNKSEIDQQIATAKQYPRSIKAFRDEALAMVTLNEAVAAECLYSLPRSGKTIEGPSARFAEVIVSAWGNSRSGARIINEQQNFITAQAVFHDLEKNVAITYEVQRRITNRDGKRFKDDMIVVTANAACSIALRNVILKGVPKAFWGEMFGAVRQTVMGDFTTLANRRTNAVELFQKYGVLPEQIFELLSVGGIEDITLEHMVTLTGIITAIKDGDTTPELAFSPLNTAGDSKVKPKKEVDQTLPSISDEKFSKKSNAWHTIITSGKKTHAELIATIETRDTLSDLQKKVIESWVYNEGDKA